MFVVVGFAAFVLTLPAFASGYYAPEYEGGLQEQQVQIGTVIAVQQVVGRGGSMIGSLVGAAAAAAVGSRFGGGAGNTIATIGGGLVGLLTGRAVENHYATSNETQVTVKLQYGQVIGVVEKGYPFSVGEQVQVIHTQGSRNLFTGSFSGPTVRILPM